MTCISGLFDADARGECTTNTSYSAGRADRRDGLLLGDRGEEQRGSEYVFAWSFTTSCVSALSPSSATAGGGRVHGYGPVDGDIRLRLDGDEQRGVDYDHFGRIGHRQRVGELLGGGEHRRATHGHADHWRPDVHGDPGDLPAAGYELHYFDAGGRLEPTGNRGGGQYSSLGRRYGVAADAAGNVYFPSAYMNAVFKVDAFG